MQWTAATSVTNCAGGPNKGRRRLKSEQIKVQCKMHKKSEHCSVSWLKYQSSCFAFIVGHALGLGIPSAPPFWAWPNQGECCPFCSGDQTSPESKSVKICRETCDPGIPRRDTRIMKLSNSLEKAKHETNLEICVRHCKVLKSHATLIKFMQNYTQI